MTYYPDEDENTHENDQDAFWALLFGAVAGLAASAIFLSLAKSKCPVCNNSIERGIEECPYCHSYLRW